MLLRTQQLHHRDPFERSRVCPSSSRRFSQRKQYGQADLKDGFTAEVFIGKADDARLTAWLRVPLPWFQSHTTSFFPDETHSTIRKIFTSPHEPYHKRIFCGYCGTHLTRWSEDPGDKAENLSITIDSIFGKDLRILEELGLLYDDDDDDVDPSIMKLEQTDIVEKTGLPEPIDHDATHTTVHHSQAGDLFWTEELTEENRLGQPHRTKRGRGRNAGGTITVEWEITEVVDDTSEAEHGSGRGKRKLGAVGPGDEACG
jgi:hypothetical protein